MLVAGGGTGGHIYIGIAIARELKRREPGADFLFVGTRRGLESRIVPQEGFRLEFIESAGLKGKGASEMARSLFRIPRSLMQSRRLVRGYSPDVVVGTGGYSSGPVVLAAWWLKRPSLIIEPNAQPGLTNRCLASVVDCAAIAFPEAQRHFKGKAIITGIPVREEFQRVPRHVRRSEEIVILLYGGSQGSHALNMAMVQTLPGLKSIASKIRLIHQTGEKDFELVRKAYEGAGMKADVRPFLPRIYEEFAAADLILSRAGASTVAEITVSGKAAILIPFAGATDDHQTRNAKALAGAGAARMIPEKELTPARLSAEIQHFLEHPQEIDRMEEAARRLAKPGAAQHIADLVLELATKTTIQGA